MSKSPPNRFLEKLRREAAAEFSEHSAKRGLNWGLKGDWAFMREAEVRDALSASDRKIAAALKTHPQAVRSSMSPSAIRADWVAPDWRTVMVFTEHGIGDPYEYAHVHEAFDKAVELLDRADPEFEWMWESINPAVHVFRMTPRSHATSNPPRVFRAQKVVAQLQKETRPAFHKGMIASSPRELVEETLDEYLSERATEVFLVLYLSVRNQVVGYTEYASGGVSGVEVNTSGVMRDALISGAAGIITIHNHPSGDATPSSDDRELWKRLREAGKLIGVPVVDNMVVGEEQFFSEMEGSTVRFHRRERSA